MGFGIPRDRSAFKSYPKTLKDGDNRRRIIPPILSCENSGEWCIDHTTHTCAIPREDDPTKFDYRTYRCVEVSKWVNKERVVISSCPECDQISDRKEGFERLQKKLAEEYKSNTISKGDVRIQLKPYLDWKKRHGRSWQWYVNVVDPDGNYFTERWPPQDVMKVVQNLKKKLKDEDGLRLVDADQGVWINIVRTPKAENVNGFPSYKVEAVMERQADGAKKEKLGPLTAEDAVKAEAGCWDLKDPGIVELTREQVQTLATCGDAPEVLRAIFQAPTKAKNSNALDEVIAEHEAEKAASAAPVAMVTPAPEPVKPKEVDPSSPEYIIAMAQAAIAKAQAAMKAQVAPVTPKVEPVKEVAKAETKLAPVETKLAPVETKLAPVETKLAPTKDELDSDMAGFMKEFDLAQ